MPPAAGAAPTATATPVVARTTTPEPSASGAAAQADYGQLSAFDTGETFMGTCPDCGSQLEYAEGCVKCHVCGFSECG